MKRIKSTIVLTILMVIGNQALVNAHGNESVEGHKDIFNKSGLGDYHYHHGFKAHLHPGGICEYREAEKKERATKQGKEDGYENGYVGLEKEYKYSENEAYYAIYKKSYDESYTSARKKAEDESKGYYNRGKELGESGKSIEGSYDNKIFDKAYKDGYNEGYEKYKSKVSEEYRQKGLNDGKEYENEMSFEGLEDYMIEAYKKGYTQGLIDYADKIRGIGYSAAFGNANSDPSYTEQEMKWYNEGLNKGNTKLNEIIAMAKNLGLEGKDESELDQFTEGKEQVRKAFEEGRAERLKLEAEQNELKLETERKENILKYGIAGVVIVVAITIGLAVKKVKKNKEENVDDKIA